MSVEWSKLPTLPFSGDDVRLEQLWWQEKGLQETATGYGGRLRTRFMVRYRNRWRRVYCACYSNIGTTYIIDRGARRTVDVTP